MTVYEMGLKNILKLLLEFFLSSTTLYEIDTHLQMVSFQFSLFSANITDLKIYEKPFKINIPVLYQNNNNNNNNNERKPNHNMFPYIFSF